MLFVSSMEKKTQLLKRRWWGWRLFVVMHCVDSESCLSFVPENSLPVFQSKHSECFRGRFCFVIGLIFFWQDDVLCLFSLKDVLHCLWIDCFCHESSVINVVVKRGHFWINFLSEHLLWKIKKNFRILWCYNNGSSGPNFFLGVLVLGIF